MPIKNVLIAGGGVGGLALAAALGRQGIQAEIAEIRPEFNVLGIGIVQPANSLRILRNLGVLEEVLGTGYTFDRNVFYDWQGEHIVTTMTNFGDDGTPQNAAMTRLVLHRALLSAATKAGTVFRMGTTIDSFADRGESVDVRLSDGTESTYDLIVGFDGLRSTMRKLVFGEAYEPVYTGSAVWRLQMPRDESVTCATLFQGDGVKAGFLPLSQDSMYLLAVTQEPADVWYEQEEFDGLLRKRLAGFGVDTLVGRCREAITGPEGIVYSPINEVNLPTPWYRGRAIIMGDAAHATAPHLTEGAGMALEDAWVLADELTKEPGRSVEDSLASTMRRRIPRATLVQNASRAVLESEQQMTAENMDETKRFMRAEFPPRFHYLEGTLSKPA